MLTEEGKNVTYVCRSMLLLYSQPAKNKEYINPWVHVCIVYAHLTCILRHQIRKEKEEEKTGKRLKQGELNPNIQIRRQAH